MITQILYSEPVSRLLKLGESSCNSLNIQGSFSEELCSNNELIQPHLFF